MKLAQEINQQYTVPIISPDSESRTAHCMLSVDQCINLVAYGRAAYQVPSSYKHAVTSWKRANTWPLPVTAGD